jgi:hypothetical protein
VVAVARGERKKPARRLHTAAGVKRWAAELYAERLNDTGRACIELVEEVLLQAIALKGDDPDTKVPLRYLAVRRAMPDIDKAIRAAIVADKAEAERAMVQLRRRADAQDAIAGALDEMH